MTASFTVREGWAETSTCLPDTWKRFTTIFLFFRWKSDQASCTTLQFPLWIHHTFLRHNRITRCPSALQRIALPVTPEDSTTKQPPQGPRVLDRFSHQAHFSLCTHCNRSLTAYPGADWTGRVGDGCLGHAVMLQPPTGRRDRRQLQGKTASRSWAPVLHGAVPASCLSSMDLSTTSLINTASGNSDLTGHCSNNKGHGLCLLPAILCSALGMYPKIYLRVPLDTGTHGRLPGPRRYYPGSSLPTS